MAAKTRATSWIVNARWTLSGYAIVEASSADEALAKFAKMEDTEFHSSAAVVDWEQTGDQEPNTESH